MELAWTKHEPVRAATHGCPHHVDELVAVTLLRRWLQEHGHTMTVSFIERDQLAERAGQFDVLVDIGGEYDPARGRFDHHQGGAEVEGRSAAGLLFDALYHQDARYDYLKPIIDYVDTIDSGTVWSCESPAEPSAFARGRAMLSISALLKAVGGFQPDAARSRRCLELIEALVATWFQQAEAYANAASILAGARRVGRGILLEDAAGYGPGLLEYLRDTDVAFVGFPDRPDRFIVVAVRDGSGDNRVRFNADLPGASFVHPAGFMAIFPDHASALEALANL